VSLLVKRIDLERYRNINSREISFDDGVTILVGPNAAGKTNTIEALQLLTAGESFRHPTSFELVMEGCESANATILIEGDGRVLDVGLHVTPEGRTFSLNGKTCRRSSLLGTLISILFNPDDLALIKGRAGLRRDEIDGFGSQVNKGYEKVCSTYRRSVEQRNRLLKEERVDVALLDAWDESLALGGATLLYHRMNLLRRLAPTITRIYSRMVGKEGLVCEYHPSLGDEVLSMDRDDIHDLFVTRLRENRADDIRRGMTLLGPHRDDITFEVAGMDARTYGSQGQQRTCVLSLKLAEVELAREITGRQPLLLLDDVMSELDEGRRNSFLDFVGDEVQTVITTTNLGYFNAAVLDEAKVVSFDGR
jgi:DNA replication and repair protein RecF